MLRDAKCCRVEDAMLNFVSNSVKVRHNLLEERPLKILRESVHILGQEQSRLQLPDYGQHFAVECVAQITFFFWPSF